LLDYPAKLQAASSQPRDLQLLQPVDSVTKAMPAGLPVNRQLTPNCSQTGAAVAALISRGCHLVAGQ